MPGMHSVLQEATAAFYHRSTSFSLGQKRVTVHNDVKDGRNDRGEMGKENARKVAKYTCIISSLISMTRERIHCPLKILSASFFMSLAPSFFLLLTLTHALTYPLVSKSSLSTTLSLSPAGIYCMQIGFTVCVCERERKSICEKVV